jgi:hypothetical protein
MRTAAQAAEQVEERTKPRSKARGIIGDEPQRRKANARTLLKAWSHGLKPEEKKIWSGLEDGTCHLDPSFSMKVIGMPNTEFQARHKKLDPEHASFFARMLLDEKEIFPVVIFRSFVRAAVNGVMQEIQRIILTDGFHRHYAYASLKRPEIPAYVFDVPDDQLIDQARLYAAMCNQVAILKRTDADKREAIRMTCAVPECEGWTDQRIADHCGVDVRTVKPTRKEYLIEHQKDLPTPPRKRPAPTVQGRKDPAPVMPKSRILPPGAEAEPTPADVRPPLHNPKLFRAWLLDRRVIAKPPEDGATSGLYIRTGLLAGNLAIVLCDGSDIEQAQLAMAKALLLREAMAAGSRATVVLNRQGPHRKLYELGERLGVDFVSPEELVEALKTIQDAGKAG